MEEAQAAPASAEPSTADKAPAKMKEAMPEVPPPKPVFVPVDPEAHKARVEEQLVAHAPLATPKPGVDFSFITRQKAAADNLREGLRKQLGMGPSDELKISGHAETRTLERANAEAAKALKKEEREKALRRLRRLEKQPAYAEHAPPHRYVGKTKRKAKDSDVQFDIHAFAGEPCVSVREGRPMLKARGSFNPRNLRASLDRKTDHLQAEVQTVIEAYREHLFQTAEAGLAEAQEEAFKEGMAVTERKWFERAAWAEAEAGRYRNSMHQAENEKQVARQTIFESEEKVKAAKAEVEQAKEAEKEALAAKEAAEKNAKEEARQEVRDELAGLRGNVLALEAVAADFERQAKEQTEAADASRKEAAEARRQAAEAEALAADLRRQAAEAEAKAGAQITEVKAEAEALALDLKGQVAEAEAKAESAVQRADEAEKAKSEALVQAAASDKALAEANEQLTREVAVILKLEQDLKIAQEATTTTAQELATESIARAEAAEKALANVKARNAELDDLVQRLEAAARAATATAEAREREAAATWARREVEVFNSAIATIEADLPGSDFTDYYLIPDLPGPPADGE